MAIVDAEADPDVVKRIQAEPSPIRDKLIFERLQEEAGLVADSELMGPALRQEILAATCLADVISEVISRRLASNLLPQAKLKAVCVRLLERDENPGLDLCAIMTRDPATLSFLHCVLFFKGFHATQAHRVAAKLWNDGSQTSRHEALALQNRTSELWGVDIHPAAHVGGGLLMDHATGIVIGETARVGKDCTILHGVTLGACTKDRDAPAYIGPQAARARNAAEIDIPRSATVSRSAREQRYSATFASRTT